VLYSPHASPSQHQPIDPLEQRVCSARPGGSRGVALMAGEAWKARAGDRVRLKSGGAVMTAERVGHGVEHSSARCVWFDARQAPRKAFIGLRAFIGLEALDLVTPEESASTDCPEVRMAGDNHNNNNNNNLR
jgi:uncharacterized protein YodC (DUF2158 family)